MISQSLRVGAVSAAEAVQLVQSGHNVFVQGMAATPHALLKALQARAADLRDVNLFHLHTEGPADYATAELQPTFRVRSLFVAHNLREAVNSGLADYIPMFLSEMPGLFRSGRVPLHVAMVQVSPPDRHGFCSLGTSVDMTNAAVDTADVVLAQINPRVPRTHGDSHIHLNQITAYVEVDEPLHCVDQAAPTAQEAAIGRYVAELVEDGATLQMGIGAIPNAVLAALTNHKDLAVHTEMFSDGVVDLVERGIINGRFAKVRHETLVATFVIGSQRLYDFVDGNLGVELLDCSFVNNPEVIRQNPKVTAINSALEVDLTGQVCADSIGTYQYSGVGGQMDFMRGAALSERGKPIIALPSVTAKGISKIVNTLRPGASVTTTRAHVHYVVTEYGVAHLYGQTLRERARALINIAHPDHREALEREAFERFRTEI